MTISETTTVQVPAGTLAAAALAMAHAGQGGQAARLLEAATGEAPEDRRMLALAAAEVALTTDWHAGTREAPPKLVVAEEAVAESGDAEARWNLGFLKLRQAYGEQLFTGDAVLRLGPAGRDPAAMAKLRKRAEMLHDEAPDDHQRGWAAMYLGLIADNVFGERESAPDRYSEALRHAEDSGDDLLAREALRHLGDHDHDDGDDQMARQRWERSTEFSARAGMVTGTLSQQLLLAVLARDDGDEAGANALATEIARWAGAVGALRLQAQAQSFLAGDDPTGPPSGDQTTRRPRGWGPSPPGRSWPGMSGRMSPRGIRGDRRRGRARARGGARGVPRPPPAEGA